MSQKKPSMVAVAPGIYERGIGSSKPYFQVKVRSKGQNINLTFPYLPAAPDTLQKRGRGRPASKDNRAALTSREVALANAKAAKGKEDAAAHFHKKPLSEVVTERTLRDWMLSYRLEACLREGPDGEFLEHMVYRKAGISDAKQVLNLIQIADDHALNHGRISVMEKSMVDLELEDFNHPEFGLIQILTGRPDKKNSGSKRAFREKPPASAATKRRALSLLNSVYQHAVEYWNLNREFKKPWDGVIIRATEKKPNTRALTLDELDKVETELLKLHRTVRAAIYFLRWTAARAGEMQKVKWENIKWSNNPNKASTILFEGTKTPRRGAYREREVPLSEGAIEALKLLFLDGTTPPKEGIIFKAPRDNRRPLARDSVYQAFVRSVQKAGVPHARLHDLRHTRTTEISVDLPTAQAMVITGHSDYRTFVRYTHLNEEAANIINEGDKRRRKRIPEKEPALPALDSVIKIIDNLTDSERQEILLKMLQKKG